MNWKRTLLSNVLRAPDDGAGAAGAGGGAGGGGGSGAGGGQGAGAGGAGDKPFHSSWGLDQAGTDYVAGKAFKEPKDVVSSLQHFEKLARDKNVITRPDPKDPKFGDHEVHELLGWVKDPAKYQLKKPEPAEGVEYAGPLMDKLRTIAHEHHVPLATAQALHDGVWGFMMESVNNLKSSGASRLKDLDAALRKEFGKDYDVKSALAKRAFEAFLPPGDDAAAMSKALGDPRMVRMFARIGEAIGEAHLPGGTAGGGGNMTPQAARSERLRLEQDPAWMKIFNDERNPLNADHKAHRAKLLEIEARGS